MLWAWLPSDPGSTCRPARFTRVSQVRTDHETREASPRLLAQPRRAGDKAARFASPRCSDRRAGGSSATPRSEAEAGAEAGVLLDGVRRMLRTAPVVIAVSFAGSARSFLLPLKAADQVGNRVAPPSASWLSGGLSQRQITPQITPHAAPSVGPPRPISRSRCAGRLYISRGLACGLDAGGGAQARQRGRGAALRLLLRLRCAVRATGRMAHGPVTLPLPL